MVSFSGAGGFWGMIFLRLDIKDFLIREGSRVAVIFPNEMPAIFHRPHHSPTTDKGAVSVIRQWLERMGHIPQRG